MSLYGAKIFKKFEKGYNKRLLIISAGILIFGLIMLYSASGFVGFQRFGDNAFYIKRQILAMAIGLLVGYLCYRLDYHLWKKWSFIILFICFTLLIAVLIPALGVESNGSQRWINLGFFVLQPSEIVKLSIILYMSAWISGRGRDVVSTFYGGFVPFIILLFSLAILMLLQPDLGTLMVISSIAVILYFLGGASWKHLSLLGLIGSVGALGAIFFAEYRMKRMLAFLNSSLDPQGAGYHIKQAIIAVGSGGLFGLGLGKSRQKFMYLPEVTSDSLFAIISEELGFFFSVSLVILYIYFFWISFKISKAAPDDFGKLVALGIGSWICIQAFVNIGAMIGVLPLTGITLPLMSYGRSSLIVTMASIGILLNISKNANV